MHITRCFITFAGAFYSTPSGRSTKQLEEFDKSLKHINQLPRNNPDVTIIAGGDFNAGHIDWSTNTVPSGSSHRNFCIKLLEILEHHNLEQQKLGFSREKRILDLFSSNKSKLMKSVHIIKGLSDQ